MDLVLNELANNDMKMSSREIADLCEKRHDHVLRDIRAYAGAVIQMERGINVRSMDWGDIEGVQLLGDTPVEGVTFSMEVNPQNKQSYPVCHLDKNTTLIIVSGYNVLLRKRIIERWAELEAQVSEQSPVMALPDFTNPALAARAWADEVEAKLIAQEQLSIAQPKADALDYISTAVNSLNARDTAKTLGVQPKKFNDWCIAHQWMYRDSKAKLQMCSNRLQ